VTTPAPSPIPGSPIPGSPAPAPAPLRLTAEQAALVAEACSKSGVLWVRTVGSSRHSLAWHVWHEGAAYVVYGVDEQMLPLMSGQIEVVVPSKDSGARLVTFVAQADILPARSPEWEAAADALAAARLNTRDAATQRDRWASGTLVTRLTPLHVVASGAGADGTPSGAAPAPEDGATTLTRHQPWHLRGRAATWRARRAARRG
jgi:hypothetical protein